MFEQEGQNKATAIQVNGADSPIQPAGLTTVSDLLELVKTTIDPDQMITAIAVDGRQLEDAEWEAAPSRYRLIEIETDLPERYVAARLTLASEIIRNIYFQFKHSRKSFQNAKMQEGNLQLKEAVEGLHAFFTWYATLMGLVPAEGQHGLSITTETEKLVEICKKIIQQQLYQSWWALGESIEAELEPALEELEFFLRTIQVDEV